jgi:probable rRNA maturation factor
MPLASASPMPKMAARHLSPPGTRRISVDVRVDAGDWPPPSALSTLACRVVDAVVAALGPRAPDDGELSLLFTDDAHIHALNRRYRNIDRATNVLSFPAPALTDARAGRFLGDIAVASETLRREATSRGLTIEAHLSHLLLHGFLHILGYDHADEAEASAMERLETGILGELGIADPYAGPC